MSSVGYRVSGKMSECYWVQFLAGDENIRHSIMVMVGQPVNVLQLTELN